MLERGKVQMLAEELAELEQRIQLVSNQVRELIGDMRPPHVEPHADLPEYIQHAVEIHMQRGGPPVETVNELSNSPPALSPLHLLALARIVQEALLNVRKHARASRVRLTLANNADYLHVTISDDGQGFDPAGAEALSTDRGGAGLANLRARAELIGGELLIGRDASGEWTEVKLALPR
jgi:signal transduction histidine kinase